MATVDIKHNLGYFWQSETEDTLIIVFRISLEAKILENYAEPLGMPMYPQTVLEIGSSLLEALNIIPWRIAEGAEIYSEDKAKHTVQHNFKLDYLSTLTRVDAAPYIYASIINLGTPSFYVATARYIVEGDDYTEIPSSMSGLEKLEDADGRGGTAFLPAKSSLWQSEVVAMSAHQVYNSTVAYLAECLPAFAGKDTDNLQRPHILLDFDEWLSTNTYARASEISIGGAETNVDCCGRDYYYYSGAVVYQLCFLQWFGIDSYYYPPRNYGSGGSGVTNSGPGPIWILPPILLGGQLARLLSSFSIGSVVPELVGYESFFLSDDPMSDLYIGGFPLEMEV